MAEYHAPAVRSDRTWRDVVSAPQIYARFKAMDIRPIATDDDYEAALGESLEVLAMLCAELRT